VRDDYTRPSRLLNTSEGRDNSSLAVNVLSKVLPALPRAGSAFRLWTVVLNSVACTVTVACHLNSTQKVVTVHLLVTVVTYVPPYFMHSCRQTCIVIQIYIIYSMSVVTFYMFVRIYPTSSK